MCATDDDFVLVQSVLAIPLIFCNRVFGGNFVHTLSQYVVSKTVILFFELFLATPATSFLTTTPSLTLLNFAYESVRLIFAGQQLCPFHFTWPTPLNVKPRKPSAWIKQCDCRFLCFFLYLYQYVYLRVLVGIFSFCSSTFHGKVNKQFRKSVDGLKALTDFLCSAFVTTARLNQLFFVHPRMKTSFSITFTKSCKSESNYDGQ